MVDSALFYHVLRKRSSALDPVVPLLLQQCAITCAPQSPNPPHVDYKVMFHGPYAVEGSVEVFCSREILTASTSVPQRSSMIWELSFCRRRSAQNPLMFESPLVVAWLSFRKIFSCTVAFSPNGKFFCFYLNLFVFGNFLRVRNFAFNFQLSCWWNSWKRNKKSLKIFMDFHFLMPANFLLIYCGIKERLQVIVCAID